jgi:hypothetical protein
MAIAIELKGLPPFLAECLAYLSFCETNTGQEWLKR